MNRGELHVLPVNEVCQRLFASNVPWVVFAGAAAYVYGAKRPITDIDILVSSSDGRRIEKLFPEGWLRYRDDGTLAGVQLVGIDIITGITGLYSLDVDKAMITRITKHKIAGVKMPVIPVEDNILLKAAWGRGSEVGKHDWEDVQAMMAFCPHLDWEYIHMRAQDNMSSSLGPEVLNRLNRMCFG
jgi:hypothetical protein